MSSLWTPGGEHKVERQGSGSAGGSSSGGGRGPGRDPEPARRPTEPVDYEDPTEGLSPEAEAELDAIREQLLDAPAEVVIGNHAYGMFELAALHLSANPPNLEKARLAVDALGALVDALRGRLGEVEGPLQDALAQIRMAFVQISAAQEQDPANQ